VRQLFQQLFNLGNPSVVTRIPVSSMHHLQLLAKQVLDTKDVFVINQVMHASPVRGRCDALNSWQQAKLAQCLDSCHSSTLSCLLAVLLRIRLKHVGHALWSTHC
jgi:hypothetical protein